MLAKIELSLAPSKAKGLSEDERLELGRLLLKAGYRVDIVRRRPNANPAKDTTPAVRRTPPGRVPKITSRRTRNGCMILFTFCGMWQMPQGLRLQSALS